MTENIQNKRTEIKIKPPVLVVDDDSNQLKVISGILSMEDLQPICFTNARDAFSVEELTELPGIGEVTAQNIVDHREKNDKFKSIEGLKEVKGIGDAKYEKVKDLITTE